MKPKLLTTLEHYSGRLFLADAGAGITVALVALPLSIAIAIASGATPESGLITAIIGGLIVSLLGGSRVQIGGPTGAFIVVVAGVIAQFGYSGLLLATLLAGLILVAAAVAGVGRFISLVPESVIEGFTVGIALIIAVSQLKDLLGLSAAVPADLVHGLPALWAARSQFNLTAFGIGLAAIAGIALFRHLLPWFPGALLVIAGVSARTLVAVRAIAPVAGSPPNSGETMFAAPCAKSSAPERWLPPIIRSAMIAESNDSTAARNAMTNAEGRSSLTRATLRWGIEGAGSPEGSSPKREKIVSTGSRSSATSAARSQGRRRA